MDNQKHILVLSPEIPYPVFKGNQSRIDQTLKLLIEAGHSVSVAIINCNQENRTSHSIEQELQSQYPAINKISVRRHPKFGKKTQKILSFLLKRSIAEKNLISNKETCPNNYKKLVRNMVKEVCPTHILVNYVKLSRAIPKSFRGQKIIDIHDIQTNILKASLKTSSNNKIKIDLVKYEAQEYLLLNGYDYIISINSNETKQIKAKLPKSKIITVPAFSDFQIKQNSTNQSFDILFVGSASPFNSEGIKLFIRHSLPVIKEKFPSLSLAIAGDVSNVASVRALKDSCITYLGRVPNLTDTYNSSKTVISPIISGAGMKVKNIEALSHGMPIVSTAFSMDGIDVTDGKNCLIRDTWSGFAEAVIQLLSNQEARKIMAESSYTLAKILYSKSAASRSYNILINDDFTFLSETHAIESPKSKSNKKRTKALIYSTEAEYLISYNISLANNLKSIGVYSEFIKMEATRENRFLADGYLVHATRPGMTKVRRTELIKELRKSWDTKGVLSANIKGVDISDDIATYKEMFPNHFSEKKEIDVVAHAILILEVLLKKVFEVKADFLIGWNGNGPHFIFLMKVAAKISGVPIFHIERGLLPDTLVFDPQGVNYKSFASGSYLPLINQIEKQQAAEYIREFATNAKTIINTTSELLTTRAQVLKVLEIDIAEKYIFFPLQIEGDSNIIINSPIYKKMEEVISDLDYVAKSLGLRVVCRPHPEKNIDIQALTRAFPNVIFDSSIHLHTMLKHSVANIVINSTVGLESILLSRPTISLGHSAYSGKGITYDSFHRDHIKNNLTKILNGGHDSSKNNSRAERLIHFLFSSCLIKLGVEDSNEHVIKSSLMKNSVIVNDELPSPLPPRMSVRYIEKNKHFHDAIKKAKKVSIYNTLPKESFQWHNGNTKPVVTNNMIVEAFSKKTEAIIELFNISAIESKVKAMKNNEENLSVTIVPSEFIKSFESKTDYVVDEYFYLA